MISFYVALFFILLSAVLGLVLVHEVTKPRDITIDKALETLFPNIFMPATGTYLAMRTTPVEARMEKLVALERELICAEQTLTYFNRSREADRLVEFISLVSTEIIRLGSRHPDLRKLDPVHDIVVAFQEQEKTFEFEEDEGRVSLHRLPYEEWMKGRQADLQA